MAPKKVKNPRKSAKYYRSNDKAREKKNAAQRKRNKTAKAKKYRAELLRVRRKDGNEGKGGMDYSHTKSGKIVRENPSTNRARQGSGGKPKKKNEINNTTKKYIKTPSRNTRPYKGAYGLYEAQDA